MAKVTIRDMPLKQAANILAQSGITLDTHQLPDGTYRAYVRKDKIQTFMRKLLIMTVILTSMVAATSCNVTRTITNESQYYQRGDTSVIIQTKTIETYDASRKLY